MKSIVKSLGINLLGTMSVAVAGFVSVLLLARWMETAEFGVLSLLLLAFNSIGTLDGVRPVLIYLGSGALGFSVLVRTAEMIMGWVGAAVAVAAFVILAVAGRGHVELYAAGLFAVGLGMYFPLSAYWGLLDSQRRTAFTGGLRSLAWTIAYVAFILLAWIQANLVWFILVMGLTNAFLFVAYRIRLYSAQDAKGGAADRQLLRRIWNGASDTLALNASALVLASADRVVLGWQVGAVQLGLYSGAYELTTKPAALLRVVATVFYPEAVQRQNDVLAFGDLWCRAVKVVFSLLAGVVFFAVLYRTQVITFTLGEKFAAVADPFGLLCIAFPLVSLGYLSAIPLQAQGDFKTQRTLYVGAACGMAALAWPAIALGGVVGAAILYLVSRMVDVALLTQTLKKLHRPVTLQSALLASVSFWAAMTAAWYQFMEVGLLCLVVFAFCIGLPRAVAHLPARSTT